MFKQASKDTNIDHHESMTVRELPLWAIYILPQSRHKGSTVITVNNIYAYILFP